MEGRRAGTIGEIELMRETFRSVRASRKVLMNAGLLGARWLGQNGGEVAICDCRSVNGHLQEVSSLDICDWLAGRVCGWLGVW